MRVQSYQCDLEGCDHECPRKDMNRHLSGDGLIRHMSLMQSSIAARYEEKIDEMKQDIKSMKTRISDLEAHELQMKYVNDCRAWIEYKPDALYDVEIYQIREKRGQWQYSTDLITGLMCYIPGPEGSAWDGARIPMILRDTPSWRGHPKPPKCQVKVGLFHANAYPSGTVSVSTINEENDWSSEITLPEILFTVQQWLAHPNFNSPTNVEAYRVFANEGIDAYNARVKDEVVQYSGYVGHHPHALQMLVEGKERLETDDIVKKAERL
ncbi:hypothetical protein ACHAWO_012580 [Cyclotella atomus]|uniref:UBC core domain-containing protein n=1 Tax=Cyclotella atomus TaxID=382360 RepID=A0ABD3QCU1_9STRA